MKSQEEKNKEIETELLKKQKPFKLVGNIVNRATKTNFLCLKCGVTFSATPHNILINDMDCPKCGKKHRWTYEEVKTFINSVENQTYELLSSEEDLITKDTGKFSTNNYAKIKHKTCGTEFSVKLSHFLKDGTRCPECKLNKKFTDKNIQEKLNKIYGNLFTLVQGSYSGRHNDMEVKCNICGKITKDKAFNFITNHRNCSFCNDPIAEKIVQAYNKDIKRHVQVKSILDLNTGNLNYDFLYNNILLELDGPQHFQSIAYFGGEERFKKQLVRDYKKNLIALENNLTLIRIPSKILKNEDLDILFSNSTTKKELSSRFKSILYIKKGKIILQKGKYIGLSSCTLK